MTTTPTGIRKLTLAEVLEELKAKGLLATARKVHFAVSERHVDRPHKDPSGRYVWTQHNIDQLTAHLSKGD